MRKMNAIFCDGKFVQALPESKKLKGSRTNPRFEIVEITVPEENELEIMTEIEVVTKKDKHVLLGAAFGAKPEPVIEPPIQLTSRIIPLMEKL